MKRTRLAMASLLAVAVLPVIGAATGADAKGAAGPLRDGNWAGTMSIGASISFDNGSAAAVAKGTGNGTFNLALDGGAATGDYVLAGSSSATLIGPETSGEADAVVGITGSLGGSASGPILQPVQGQADVTGSVSVNGFDTPFEQSLSFGPDDIIATTLKITRSSCTYASGTWAQEIKSAIQSAGVNVTSFQGSWAAVYKGGSAGAPDATLADILSRGEAILSQFVADGTLDVNDLSGVLTDAELYRAAGPKKDACSPKVSDDWASPLAGLIERLLGAVAHSPSTTGFTIWVATEAGTRAGVLPSAGDSLEGDLHAKAQQVLDAAIANGGTSDITFIAIAANSMGWTDIFQQIPVTSVGGK